MRLIIRHDHKYLKILAKSLPEILDFWRRVQDLRLKISDATVEIYIFREIIFTQPLRIFTHPLHRNVVYTF